MSLKLATFQAPKPINSDYSDDKLGLIAPYKVIEKSLYRDEKICAVTKLEDGTIRLTFNVETLGVKHFDVTREMFKARTKFVLYTSIKHGIVCVENDYLNKSIDGYAKIYYHMVARNEVAANVYFHDSWNEGMVFVNYQVVSNEEFINTNGGVWVGGFMAEHFPESQTSLVDNVLTKRKILFDINTIDSVVALEQQLDLLTELVSKLINKEEIPNWYENFISKIKDNSVSTLSTADKLITSIEKQKVNIRNAQKEYFANRK
jgi:hypothetical protein